MEEYPAETLGLIAFGEYLLDSQDLDPVYVALDRMNWGMGQAAREKRARWLVAYWCLYHCGAASYLADLNEPQFWLQLVDAAENLKDRSPIGKWPRGSERRHWRGAAALASAEGLMTRYEKAEEMLSFIRGPDKLPIPFKAVHTRVTDHYGFGGWIAFKVADMFERVLRIPVEFENADVFMYETPRKGVELAYQAYYEPKFDATPLSRDERCAWVLQFMAFALGEHQAPPGTDRPLNLQEYETILCKWKSHIGGHYPLFKDICEIHEGLAPWLEYSPTAREFGTVMPRLPKWSTPLL